MGWGEIYKAYAARDPTGKGTLLSAVAGIFYGCNCSSQQTGTDSQIAFSGYCVTLFSTEVPYSSSSKSEAPTPSARASFAKFNTAIFRSPRSTELT